MWVREYRDYKIDEDNIKNKVHPGRGICGCEMHELHGWGNTLHRPKRRSRGWVGALMMYFFGKQL